MVKRISIDFEKFMITLLVLFGMLLIWNLLIGNHRKNIERDKYLIENCKVVQEEQYIFSKEFKCRD